MKHLSALLFLLLPLGLLAQNNEGVISYEQVVKIKIDESRIPEGMGDMAKLIPKEQRFKKKLAFNANTSLYTAVMEEEDEVVEASGPGMRMRAWMERADDASYFDLKKNRAVEQKEFFGRTFLIEDDLEKLTWKVTGQQKEILGYPCMEATTMKDTLEIQAWFAPTIPVSTGPESMGGQLPGMVMEVSLREGMVTISATEVEFRKVKKSELNEPKKGKEVTREEYEEIVAKKIEEMREQWGGRGGGGRHMMIAR
jgi:GLPGLI family protein